MSTTIAAAPVGAGPTAADRAGHVEETGIEFIPEAARDSRPANLAAVFFGGNLAFSVIIFGWLPITFGLGWWSTVTASAVGLAIGTLVTVPLALLGPRTGTNNTVSSGAHFGVTGRLVGSVLTLAFALAYAAIAVWTSGDALVASAHRLLGTPAGDGALAVGYALIALEIAVVALYGHGTVVALQRLVVPVVGALLLVGIVAFAGSFDAGYHGGGYVLDGFWPTWMLAVTVAAAGPLSYAPSLGDYSRRISHQRHGDRPILLAAGLGVFGGLFATTLFGAFTAVAIGRLGDAYVADLVAAAPAWYVPAILVVGLAGGVGQGVLNLYASGLDLEALVPRLRRVHTTLIASLAAIVLLYAGTFALDAVDSITAMTLVLNGVAVPWVVVNLLGFLVARRGRYDPHDLQAFNEGRRGGRYWFTGGWNLRALAAWAAGSAFGVCAVSTSLYTGPLANLASGVDVSLAGSALVAAVVYLLALALWPEEAR
jgi:purine-cytosine permease-like protein